MCFLVGRGIWISRPGKFLKGLSSKDSARWERSHMEFQGYLQKLSGEHPNTLTEAHKDMSGTTAQDFLLQLRKIS